MVTAISTTGQLLPRPHRTKLELTLVFLNLAAYALATSAFVAAL